jgi:hypothetical protein
MRKVLFIELCLMFFVVFASMVCLLKVFLILRWQILAFGVDHLGLILRSR